MADGKGPEEKLLACAEWEAITQRSAEKGQPARENAAREYEERKAKRDQAEQDRIEKDNRKRANVARNLAVKTESKGVFASLGETSTRPAKYTPLTTLQYLREQLTAANNKEPIYGTKPNVSNGPISSGITKLSNLIHKQMLNGEMHVSNLKSRKDEFGISTTAATTPGLLKAILNCLYVDDINIVTPRAQGLGVVPPDNFGR